MRRSLVITIFSIALVLGLIGYRMLGANVQDASAPQPMQKQAESTSTPTMFDVTLTVDSVSPATKHTVLQHVSALTLIETISMLEKFDLQEGHDETGTTTEKIGSHQNGPLKKWRMYVNGNQSNVGPSQYILKPNDSIEWKYE